MSKNYYEILEVSPYAQKDEIKSSFRMLVRKFHPDINKSPEAEAIFKKINEAIEILSDDVQRLKYDHSINLASKSKNNEFNDTGNNGAKNSAFTAKNSGTKNTQQSNSQNTSQKSSVKADFTKSNSGKAKKGHNSNFSEILHHFFEDKNIEATSKIKKINGENIVMTLELSNKEAIEGTIKKVNIVHSEQCAKCAGKKFINGAKCTLCSGSGEKIVHKKVSITIPKNPKNGTVIKVPREGKPGRYGGKSGDLIITLKIKQLDIFKIDKGTATLIVPITPPEALLGCDIKIPTLGGTTVMKIPPQTNSGQKFKILNAGIMHPKTGIRGDLIVVVKIDVPQKPTLAELKLYRELKNLDTSDVRKELFT